MTQPYSLQKQLVVFTSIFSVVMGCILVFSAYRTALEETNEILDAQLKNLAERVAKFNPDPVKSKFSHLKQYHEEDLFVDVWAYDQQSHLHEKFKQLVEPVAKSGFYHHTNHYGKWHTYVIPLKTVQVQVSQQDSVRQALAIELAINMFLPYLIIMPFAIYGLGFIIRRNFAPFEQFKSELSTRKPNELTVIDPQQYPIELIPSIQAINQLFQRISDAQQEQKQFIADAAHELRTPITALNLQTKILLKELPHHESLIKMNSGLHRTQHLVGQLLNLAQQDSLNASNEKKVSIRLDERAYQSIEQLIHLALTKEIDLGMERYEHVQIINYSSAIDSILTNLIENAIKYTPPNGIINVSTFQENDIAIIQVEDSGPGISADLYERIKKRFYRVEQHQEIGSGLGLSIVEKAVERMGGNLIFDRSPQLGGLLVRVEIKLH